MNIAVIKHENGVEEMVKIEGQEEIQEEELSSATAVLQNMGHLAQCAEIQYPVLVDPHQSNRDVNSDGNLQIMQQAEPVTRQAAFAYVIQSEYINENGETTVEYRMADQLTEGQHYIVQEFRGPGGENQRSDDYQTVYVQHLAETQTPTQDAEEGYAVEEEDIQLQPQQQQQNDDDDGQMTIVEDVEIPAKMVETHVRKRHKRWSEDNMAEALYAIKYKEMGWTLAAKTFNVPQATLRSRAMNNRGSNKGDLEGHISTFNVELENELVRLLKELDVHFLGLTTLDIRRFAYEIASVKNIPNRFSREYKLAGWDWLEGFRNRNPSISLRTVETSSAAKARAFNKVRIGEYFDRLEKVIDEHKFSPENIYNMDEFGLSTVSSINSIILATGKRKVGVLTSAEGGQHLTVVCCFNAIGTYVPPVLLFPRKNMENELMDQAPAGALGLAQETGWMTGETFLTYLKHFVKHVKPSVTNKVLLLLDGHSSRKDFEALTYAKDNGIIVFCFPPHCTYRVQPLDVCFFGPLMSYYNQELFRWLKSNPERTVTHFQVGGILKEAYNKAATVENAVKSFSKTGIYPLNKNIFPEWMFDVRAWK